MRLGYFCNRFASFFIMFLWLWGTIVLCAADTDITLREYLVFGENLKQSKANLEKVAFPEKPNYAKRNLLLRDLLNGFAPIEDSLVDIIAAKEKAVLSAPSKEASSAIRGLALSDASDTDILIKDYTSQKSDLCKSLNQFYETFRALRNEHGRVHLVWSHAARQSSYIADAKHLFRKGMEAIYCKDPK